jgi:hypothetical protein
MSPARRLGLAMAVILLTPGAGPLAARAGEFSAAYQASLRRTVELRRQRRMSPSTRPVGTIVPWPLPPTLIIRQTSEVHGEIGGLLRGLRR